VGVDLSNRELTLTASADDSLTEFDGLQHLVLGAVAGDGSCNTPSDTGVPATNKLVGLLPSWLEKLSGSLLSLALECNAFTGSIDTISQLKLLTYLGLESNHLNGSITAVALLPELTYFNANNNRLSGAIVAVAHLTKLTYLDLGGGNDFDGHIDAVRQLTSLNFLGLNGNSKLNGPIDAIVNFTELNGLRIEDCGFDGRVPAEGIYWNRFTRPGTGTGCNIAGNQFSCPLPLGAIVDCTAATCGECVGSSEGLAARDCTVWQSNARNSHFFTEAQPPACQDSKYLEDPCSCTGVITCASGRLVGVNLSSRGLTLNASANYGLSRLDGLQNLTLDSNSLVGPLPSWLGQLAGSLKALHLGNNQLTGQLNPTVHQLMALTYLHLGNNQLTGQIRANCAGLTYLNLGQNRLDGPIDAVKGLTALVGLDLDGNQLSGPIDAIEGLKMLTSLYLNNNPKLTGSIDAVADLTELTRLHLANDAFSGMVPFGPINLSKISDCHLQGNHFRCPLPPGAATSCAATCTNSSA
jgi:Leucine-rich repeat (LRR) protein